MVGNDSPPHLAILDAYDGPGEGRSGLLGCPRRENPRRFYAGEDAIAVDMVAARHMGVANARRSPLIAEACYWFGDPSAAIAITGPDEPIERGCRPRQDHLGTLLSSFARLVYTIGGGRSALFVPEMDEGAFPRVAPEGPLLRAGRRAIRGYFALQAPGVLGVNPQVSPVSETSDKTTLPPPDGAKVGPRRTMRSGLPSASRCAFAKTVAKMIFIS